MSQQSPDLLHSDMHASFLLRSLTVVLSGPTAVLGGSFLTCPGTQERRELSPPF